MDRSLVPRVELVPFLDDSVPVVEGWLRSEHLRKSWIDTEAAISALHDPNRRRRQRIILVNDEPVGFLQWEHIERTAWVVVDAPDGAIDIDILIGSEANCGRGIGCAAITRLVADLGSNLLLATTSLSSLASRRAFQKAGFIEKEQFYKPGSGRMVLLVRPPKEQTVPK